MANAFGTGTEIERPPKSPEQAKPSINASTIPLAPEPMLAVSADFTDALVAFALDLHKKLREVGGSKNVLFSPFLAAGALIALYRGASGRAAKHLAHLLHVEGLPVDRVVAYYALCHGRLLASWPNHNRTGFNATHDLALIRDRSVDLFEEYVAALSPWCRMEPDFFETDMGSSVARMDLWIRALTSFAFREYVVFGLPPAANKEQTLLVSIAVLCVKGRWRHRFEPGFGTFRETSIKVNPIRVMRRVGLFRVGDCPGLDATVLEIPYQDPSKSMVVFLPRMERLATFEHSLTPATLLRCVANLSERLVEVTLPVLRLKRHTELAPTVSLLGGQDVIRNRGCLGASSENKALSVSRLTHVTVFQANARGGRPPLGSTSTEAQTSAPNAAAPEQFTVDRPFMFVVMNRNPDAILVLGSVKKVSSKKMKSMSLT